MRDDHVGWHAVLHVPHEHETDILPVQRDVVHVHVQSGLRRVRDAHKPRGEVHRREQAAPQIPGLSGRRGDRE